MYRWQRGRLSTWLTTIVSGYAMLAASYAYAADKPATEPKSLVEPFDAPPLAELDARAGWVERPVLDGMAILRRQLAAQPVLATVAEALKLRNTSTDANAKILSALGQLPKAEANVNYDATLTRHIGGDVRTTNPIMGSSSAEFEVAGLTNFGLFSFDASFTPFAAADVVRSWQTSRDQLIDKIVLRDDLTWSDGRPITAHDVEFSFLTIMNPRVPVPAMRSGTDKLRYVKAYDDRTIVFFHKEALATNVWNINFGILPKHVFAKSIDEDPTLFESPYHVQTVNSPVCGGPYRVASRIRGQEIVLERREDYYQFQGKQVREKPYFKRIRFRVLSDSNTTLLALKTGEIDESILTPEQWQNQTGSDDFYKLNTKVRGTEWVYFYFGWNNQDPIFKDVRVRRAMSYAFDYEEMLKNLCYGLYEPCNGVFHPTAWMTAKPAPKPYQQDLDQAEKLLEQAGWSDTDNDGRLDKLIDGKRVPFEFSILCNSAPLPVSICALLKENLEKIGIVCNVRPLEYTVLQDREIKHEFQAYMGGWGTGADPDTSDNLWCTGEGRNFVQYSNPEVDKLYEQGRREFDRAKRAEIYGRIHRLIYDDQPYTWLYFRSSFYGFNRQLRGYNLSPRGPYGYSPGIGSLWKPAIQQ